MPGGSATFVLALTVELYLPGVRSLKAKRALVKPVVVGLDRRPGVAASEVGHHDEWNRTAIGVAVVGGTVRRVEELADEAERWIWSDPQVQVLGVERTWLELDR